MELRIFSIAGCVITSYLIVMGALMRTRLDASFMLRSFWRKDNGLYMWRFFRHIRLGDDTPQNSKKYSRIIGNYFIVVNSIGLLMFIGLLVYSFTE